MFNKMFCEGIKNNYKINQLDLRLYDGIPLKYFYLKHKKFGDWEIPPWELFIFKDRLLGQGSFSKVYLAKWRETFVVAKVIKDEIISMKKYLIEREIDIMSKLHHPNIVQFLGYIDDPFIIVMEYIPNNNLEKNKNLLNKSQKINIFKNILQGLAYIHNRKPYPLIHRDIKPTNILLTNSKVAKITDFGLSKFYNYSKYIKKVNSNNSICETINENEDQNEKENLELDSSSTLTKFVGTERYMAPELLNELNNEYDESIDIYACGIMMYEIFEGKKIENKEKLKYFWTPKKLRKYINLMLDLDHKKRPTALELLNQIKI